MTLSYFHLALAVGLLFRVTVFLYFTLLPVGNAGEISLSTLRVATEIDYSFYKQSLELFLLTTPSEIFDLFFSFYRQPVDLFIGPALAGPVVPTLIYLFDYRDGNTLPLYLFFLVVGSGLFVIWLKWLHANGIGNLWLFAFALAPNPIWFMLNPSTDLPFACLFAMFYLVYFRVNQRPVDAVFWITVLVLLLLTRPNGYSVLLFVFLDFLIRSWGGDRQSRTSLVGLALLLVVFSIYLYPYFAAEMRKATQATEFYGIEQADYARGLYSKLPVWLDIPLSWLSLAAAKILYFTGLRPSYSDITWPVLLARSGIGVILLFGLIYLVVKGTWRDQLLLICYVFPIFLGATQERYNLAVQPILFLFGVKAIDFVQNNFRNHLGTKIIR